MAAIVLACWLCLPASIGAHPAPFSYLDIHITSSGLTGRLVVHNLDAAHELGLNSPERLVDATLVEQDRTRLAEILAPRLRYFADGHLIPWSAHKANPVASQDAIEILWSAPATRPIGRLTISTHLFPYDPNHQTFINVYENDALVRQEVASRDHTSVDFYAGTRQGLLAVFTAFTLSGIHHIAIGPDHVLFVVGLLLLGGTLTRLLAIVTAFTVGHSITLALATLGIFSPPARIIEPAIALSIVYVGADNLLAGAKGRDVRAWVALAFGLIHGFGFASVLRETGLPDRALGLSLFSFNLGVEIGQAAIVIVVASALALIRKRNATIVRRIATVGSIAVIVAGAFWFFERIL
jgi:hydrogenase/urease accessory protein HupE